MTEAPATRKVVRNVSLLGEEGACDIAIEGGRISERGPQLEGETLLDGEGALALPAFVNPHLHLCKVFTLDWQDDAALDAYHAPGMKDAGDAIDLASRIKSQYSVEKLLPKIEQALFWAEHYGNLHIRAFADVDGKVELRGLEAVLEAKRRFGDRLNLQVVAFAQDGIVREEGATRLIERGMEMGANVVGGIPWIEASAAAQQKHVDTIFEIARRFDAPVSMLLDDSGDASLRTLEMMCRKAIETGWEGRCLAHHCRALSVYDSSYKNDILYPLMRDAGVSLVSNPHTGPLHASPREMDAAGINLCLGQDDVTDAYYPFGRNNMLEVAFLAAHVWMLTRREEGEVLLDMVTSRAAVGMGLEDYGLAVGCSADMVIVQGDSPREALRFHEVDTVIRKGNLV
ncbi:MAG: amidohydrolase family protein [Verrucomicrobiota bacterium]